MCLCSCLCPWTSLPAQQMFTNSARISVFGVPPPRSSDPGRNSARLCFWLPPAQFPPSYEAVAPIYDAQVLVFAHPQRNIAMTSVCVCARVCASVDVLVLPTLVCDHLNIPINSNRLLGLVVRFLLRVREVPGSIPGAALVDN